MHHTALSWRSPVHFALLTAFTSYRHADGGSIAAGSGITASLLKHRKTQAWIIVNRAYDSINVAGTLSQDNRIFKLEHGTELPRSDSSRVLYALVQVGRVRQQGASCQLPLQRGQYFARTLQSVARDLVEVGKAQCACQCERGGVVAGSTVGGDKATGETLRDERCRSNCRRSPLFKHLHRFLHARAPVRRIPVPGAG
jgi:hypothetical protein